MKLLTFAAALCMIVALNTDVAAGSRDCNEVEALALNMYHEARGEGIDGMIMVAEVTLNRVEHPRFPNTICRVVYQRRQFSWTHAIRDHTPREVLAWNTAFNLAESILLREVDTFGTGATHYLNPNAVRRMPSWTYRFDRIGRVGNHVFYRKT
jgi:N-acetylmuramoyl-L-alanine amidase